MGLGKTKAETRLRKEAQKSVDRLLLMLQACGPGASSLGLIARRPLG